MKDLAGKVAAVTGAASGIGRALAIALVRRGCSVALSDVDESGLAETAVLAQNAARESASAARAAKSGGSASSSFGVIEAADVRVTTKRVDVSNRDAVKTWAKDVVREHGVCNLVFNNAGIAYAATAESADPEDFARVIDIDFWGVVHGTQAFLPYLRASGDGHVVNTSSLFGLIAFPGQSTYNAAKFAVRGYTEALRVELEITRAPVSASTVHPGGIKTNIARASKMHPSMADLGIDDNDAARRRFEKAFRVTADDAAETILRGVEKNSRRILIGTDARILDLLQRILPSGYQGLLALASRRTLSRQNRPIPRPAPEAPRRRPVVNPQSN